MPKIGEGADEDPDGRTFGDIPAMQMPVGTACQIVGETSEGTFFEDFLTAGEAKECGQAQWESCRDEEALV